MSSVKFTNISNLAGTKSLTTDQVIDRSTCQAWAKVTITGGTPVITSNFNFKGISDDGVGQFRLNFTSAMSDANYAEIITMSGNSDSSNTFSVNSNTNSYSPTTSYAVACTKFNGSVYDPSNFYIAVFR